MITKFFSKTKAGKNIKVNVSITERTKGSLENPIKEYKVNFPFNRYLIGEVKIATWKRRWEQATKSWILPRTLRNKRWIALMSGENIYEAYDKPLVIGDPLDTTDPLYIYLLGMWKHQPKMFAHMIQRKHAIVAGEMRTGKTLPTIRAMQYVLDHISSEYIEDQYMLYEHDIPIFVGTKSSIKGLKKELEKWAFPYEIRLLTYDKFRTIFDECPEAMVPRVLVFDECQALKTPTSIQGRTARQLTEKQIEKFGFENCYTWLLSGTPSPKDPSDWWNVTEVTYHGFLREGSNVMLKDSLANIEMREGQIGQKYPHLISWKEDEIERLHKRLSGLVEVFLKKDCLDLPQKIYSIIELPVSDMYKKSAAMLRKTEIQKVQLLNKLRQISDGFIYQDGDYDEETGKTARKVTYFPNCPKDQQLKDDLDFFQDDGRVVIYCGYQASMDKVTKICIDKDWVVLQASGKGWKALNTTVHPDILLDEMDASSNKNHIEKIAFVAQADAASTGIELSASPVVIYYSNSYNGGARMQSEDRPYSNNMDKSRGLEIRDYIHLPTDLLVRNNLLNKKEMQAVTMGEIFESLEDVLEKSMSTDFRRAKI